MSSISTDNIDVSIIIVNWNTRHMTCDCLRSVYEQTQGVSFEVILIDNASYDDSVATIKKEFSKVKLIANNKNLGFCKATNQGLEVAKGKYLLLLNSDTVVLENAVEKTIQFAEKHDRIGIVGCQLIYPDGSFQGSCFRFPGICGSILASFGLSKLFPKSTVFNMERYGNRLWDKPREVDCVMGSFMLIKRQVTDNIGMLDTDYFMYGEETDFCFRAVKAGWKVFYYPDAKLIHYYGGSKKSYEDAAWAYRSVYRGIYLFMNKRRSKMTLYVCNLMLVATLFFKSILWVLRDVILSARRREFFKPRHSKKIGCLVFHTQALLNPKLFSMPWSKK